MTEITLGQFIDNMEKNGYPQITGDLWWKEWDDSLGKEVCDITKGGCAIGQAYWNTFHTYELPQSFFDELNNNVLDESPEDGGGYHKFSDIVIEYNDNQGVSIPEIAKKMRELFKDKLDTIVHVTNEQPLIAH